MPGYRVEGYIFVNKGQRATDYLNTRDKSFIAVTDAKIYDWKGDLLEQKEFIAVNKDRISLIAES